MPALVLSASEMRRIVLASPFVPSDAVKPEWLYVTFLFEHSPDPAAVSLDVTAGPGERAVRVGSAVYLCLPTGYGHTKLNNAYFENALGTPATTRNWRTVRALAGLADTREGERGAIDPQ